MREKTFARQNLEKSYTRNTRQLVELAPDNDEDDNDEDDEDDEDDIEESSVPD